MNDDDDDDDDSLLRFLHFSPLTSVSHFTRQRDERRESERQQAATSGNRGERERVRECVSESTHGSEQQRKKEDEERFLIYLLKQTHEAKRSV